MMKYLLIGTGLALFGGGVALAQMPPGGAEFGHDRGPHDREMMEHHMRRGPPPHGTAFHFRSGDAEVDIACSDRETLQACVTAATTLLDKLGTMPQPKPTTP